MTARKLQLFLLALLTLVALPAQNVRASHERGLLQQTPPVASMFSQPLGLTNGVIYQPRVTPDNLGNIIENTDYGVKNPDLKNSSQGNITCFGFDWRDLYHAGEDLYHPDRNIDTVGTDVFAVADGIVKDVSAPTWPGSAIIIEHTLPSAQKVYSVYIHVDDVAVLTNDIVYRDQKLGTVVQQPYSGWFPEYHTKSNGELVADSHLHFEIRYFEDGANIYTNFGYNYPTCNGAYAARAYTPPDIHPDNFPAAGGGYTDPTNFINSHQEPTSTPTPQATSTPLPTSTATFTPFPTSTLLPAAGTLTCYSDNPSIFDCVQIDPYTVRWNIIGNPSTAPNITGQFEVQHPNQPVYVTAHWDEPSWVSIHGWQTNPEGRYGIIGLPSVYVNDGGHGAPCSFNPDKLCGSFAVGTWNFIQPAATNSFKRATVGFQIYPDPPATVHWNPQNAYIIVSSAGYGGAPTPQPTPTSSCPWWEPWFLCPGASGQSNLQQLKLVSLVSSNLAGSLEEVVLDVQLFYRVRDELLSLTPQGNHLIDLYYQYGPEIGGLLLADSGLYQEGVSLLQIWEPKLRALVDGQGNTVPISQVEVDSIENFLLNLEAVASNELRTVLQNERINLDMQRFVGETMSQAWDEINAVETPTPTSTPTFTPTNTSTPTSTPTLTHTPTHTPTPTLTSTPVPAFPDTSILDDFNRANGAIGSNWSGNTSKYSISSNQLLVTSNDSNSDIYFSGQALGADQEAYVTFANVHATAAEQNLILKSQSNTTWGSGMIEVLYDAPNQRVQVWTWEWPAGWAQHGADIPVTFVNGDTFGARALANGDVEVYKNGELLGVRDVTSWSYYDQGGYIGLWFIGAQNTKLDDFGGGALPNGMQSLMADAPSSTSQSGMTAAQRNVKTNSASPFWQGIPMKTNQTASVTFANLQASVKPQSNGVWGEDTVQVLYDVPSQRIQVWRYNPAQGWVQIGKDIPTKFTAGDVFTVCVLPGGTLEISRNGKLLAKRKASP